MQIRSLNLFALITIGFLINSISYTMNQPFLNVCQEQEFVTPKNICVAKNTCAKDKNKLSYLSKRSHAIPLQDLAKKTFKRSKIALTPVQEEDPFKDKCRVCHSVGDLSCQVLENRAEERAQAQLKERYEQTKKEKCLHEKYQRLATAEIQLKKTVESTLVSQKEIDSAQKQLKILATEQLQIITKISQQVINAAKQGNGNYMSDILLSVADEHKVELCNVYVKDGWTPLMFAVWSGSPQCVQLLLDSGAEIDVRTFSDGRDCRINAQTLSDRNAQELAITFGNKTIIRILEEHEEKGRQLAAAARALSPSSGLEQLSLE